MYQKVCTSRWDGGNNKLGWIFRWSTSRFLWTRILSLPAILMMTTLNAHTQSPSSPRFQFTEQHSPTNRIPKISPILCSTFLTVVQFVSSLNEFYSFTKIPTFMIPLFSPFAFSPTIYRGWRPTPLICAAIGWFKSLPIRRAF